MLKYDLTPEIPMVVLELANLFNVPVYIVGGAVRDLVALAENVPYFEPPTDWDLEAYADSYGYVAERLKNQGYSFKETGNHFPVFKVETSIGTVDIALPRAEVSTGPGHKDFTLVLLTHEERYMACERRDFTINAMMYNPKTFELYDPFGGRNDLIERKLAIVNSRTFQEDPLRVLRAAKFLSRFRFNPWDIHCICAGMNLSDLPKERIYWEFVDMLRDGSKPSLGLQFLKETGHLDDFPELGDLVGVPQDPSHHPEGDAFVHTCMVADQACAYKLPLYSKFAALTHDMGKVTTTVKRRKNGMWKWTSWGHDEAGETLAYAFMHRITDDADLIDRVVAMTVHHMRITLMLKMFNIEHVKDITDRQLRKLAAKIQPISLHDLIDFTKADRLGRKLDHMDTPVINVTLTCQALHGIVNKLGIAEAPEPRIITGKVLIDMGVKPGPLMGELIDLAYDAQLNCEFHTEVHGRAWVQQRREYAQAIG